METGTTTTTTTIDITPIVNQQKITNEILLIETGFNFALLVVIAFCLVFRGLRK